MKSVNNKILVRVDMAQKNAMMVGNVLVQTANLYATNYREKSPVIGVFAESNKFFKEGDIAIFHHNHFYHPSPYYLQDDLYSVPMNKTIFGVLNSQGELTPVMGNILCNRIPVKTPFPVPPDQQKFHINQYEVTDRGWTTYKKGNIILTRPNAGYEIVFFFDKIEKRIIKVTDDQICGVVKKKIA